MLYLYTIAFIVTYFIIYTLLVGDLSSPNLETFWIKATRDICELIFL
jgi:hypothetical protein